MFRKKNLATFNLSPKAAEKMRSTYRPKVPVLPSVKPVSVKKAAESGKSAVAFFKNHSLFLGFVGILLIGMIVGTVSAQKASDHLLVQLDFLFASNFRARLYEPAGNIFVTSLASSFLFILATAFSGCSLWGSITIPLITFFRGFGIGILSGYLYASYGWQGFLFHLLVIAPGMFVSSIGIAYGAEKSLGISIRLFLAQKKGVPMSSHSFKQYFFMMGKACMLITIGALLDMVCTACFSGLFQF